MEDTIESLKKKLSSGRSVGVIYELVKKHEFISEINKDYVKNKITELSNMEVEDMFNFRFTKKDYIEHCLEYLTNKELLDLLEHYKLELKDERFKPKRCKQLNT